MKTSALDDFLESRVNGEKGRKIVYHVVEEL